MDQPDRLSAGPALTDAELAQLLRLLARFGEHDLDQFAHMRFDLPHSSVHVELLTNPRQDVSPDIYSRVWPLPEHLRVAEL